MTGKAIDVQKLTQRRITMPAILVVGLVVLGWRADSLTVDYLDDFFITRAVAEEQYEGISKQVAQNATLITGHIRTYELNENARDIARQDHLENVIPENRNHRMLDGRLRVRTHHRHKRRRMPTRVTLQHRIERPP